MKKTRKKDPQKRTYQKPIIKSEKEPLEPTMNCPTTNVKWCGVPYSPKKG
ncbi:MAG: hypothetical protein AB1711_12205 [Thermodesulfobacteriota bacterium]